MKNGMCEYFFYSASNIYNSNLQLQEMITFASNGTLKCIYY